MMNSLPDFSGSDRCAKIDVSEDGGEAVDDDNDNVDETKKDDNDDSVLLSQAMNEGDWIAPTQPDKASFLSSTLREGLLKQLDEIPFAGDAYMLTQEINRLRKQLGNSLGENQMLMYKVKNLNRENALLQDNLIQIQQTFEQRFLEQKNDFEKTERDMRNVITYQEQDLKTKEFRDRLNNSALVPIENTCSEVLLFIFFHVTETTSSGRQESSIIRVKKISIPSVRRGNCFPRTLNDAPILRKAFSHCKLILNDTFRAINSQGKCVNSTTFNQRNSNDPQDDRIAQASMQNEMQPCNPNLCNCLMYLRPDNQLPQLYGICDEMITLGFRSIPELLRKRELKTPRLMHDVLVEPRKRWCR
ncbi:unnamed protein product [Litomosoides sigmodontis]|uniref:Uncharacterized protein n=1 Tax=Litomosoides sigmodontis TaxID=42156 RepID=A0A3P6TAN2_LITSI|nr:unnamed protein product [Litomosoides sigmodontis]